MRADVNREYIANTEMFTIATMGYGPFTLNLCASMRRVGIGNELVVYTPDRSLYDDLVSRNIRAVHLGDAVLPDWSDHLAPGFNLIVALKFAIALEIMKSGRNAFFIDGDIVFLRNPREYLNEIVAKSANDMIMQYETPQDDYNTGFWFARPTQPVIGVLTEVQKQLSEQRYLCDQRCFNAIWKQFEGLSLQKLDVELFACGNQFLGNLTDAIQVIDRSEAPFPFDKAYILHFNYLVGKDNKVNAIKKMNAVYYPPLEGLPETKPSLQRRLRHCIRGAFGRPSAENRGDAMKVRTLRWVPDAIRSIGKAIPPVGRLYRARDRSRAERDALLRERETLIAAQKVLRAERDLLVVEKEALITQRDALAADKEQMSWRRVGLDGHAPEIMPVPEMTPVSLEHVRSCGRCLIYTAYDQNYAAVAAFTVPAMRKYAANHGFDFEEYIDRPIELPMAWAKIEIALEKFAEGYDTLVWIDADALVRRFDEDIRIYADDDHDFYFVGERGMTPGVEVRLNAGLFMMRRTSHSEAFLRAVLRRTEYTHHAWWEQAAIMAEFGLWSHFDGAAVRPDEPNRFTERLKYLPSRWNNFMGHDLNPDPIVRHFIGLNAVGKVAAFKLDAIFDEIGGRDETRERHFRSAVHALQQNMLRPNL
jgi:Nucleotide-diphospho-sugar transferase